MDTHTSRPVWPVYAAEALCSIGTTLLAVAVFFWTNKYLGWDLKQNFLLAAAQGATYLVGALLAQTLATRFGRRRALIVIYTILSLIALTGALRNSAAAITAVLLAYAFVAGMNWPMLESLVSTGADAHQLSRRVSIYNAVWSLANTITIALSGRIIEHSRPGVFIVSAAANFGCAMTIYVNAAIDPSPGGPGSVPTTSGKLVRTEPNPPAPEPELLASRTLAMWLSRISLPATYVIVYSIMAMMPSLPVMQPLSTATRTLVSSIWMAARWLTFVALGATAWWHTRPRLLLAASALMLLAFLGVTIPPSALFSVSAYTIDLTSMISWQLLLGAAMGLIYAGSLYFGMVLSDGSTEHGGYHEALIGLGSVLGPGAGALTQTLGPHNPYIAIAAVSSVILATLIAATYAALRFRRH